MRWFVIDSHMSLWSQPSSFRLL